ncbi:MAG: tail fiber domain-containing protein, partial [Prevotella sp.]|nr:tail fiber domain-containing protein [Prevotella sp.]
HTGAKSCFGLFSTVDNTYGQIYERSQSITGIARGSCTQGQTFGVVGSYEGYGGAGVYGSIYNNTPVSDGRYAGFFAGNVKVTGTLNGVVISSSDLRLKQDVRELGETDGGTLDKLDMLSPVSYKYDASKMEPAKEVVEGDLDKGKASRAWTNPVYEKTHFGLVAQELQEVYPDLVYENDNGYLSVNYTELIPILIQSIKELNAKVEQLSSPSTRKAKTTGTAETTDIESSIADVAGMDQNVPNPFSGETDIPIYLPETVKMATLYIYDLSGKQVEQHAIDGRGDTTMTIHADKMDAGMYIYSLIADGKVVATKRMIVVK